jgi:hypothetical protein
MRGSVDENLIYLRHVCGCVSYARNYDLWFVRDRLTV